jgi:hypothetical protein
MGPYWEANCGLAALKIRRLLLRLVGHYLVHKSLQLDAILSHNLSFSTLEYYFHKKRLKLFSL